VKNSHALSSTDRPIHIVYYLCDPLADALLSLHVSMCLQVKLLDRKVPDVEVKKDDLISHLLQVLGAAQRA
jgi:hypothetical protein